MPQLVFAIIFLLASLAAVIFALKYRRVDKIDDYIDNRRIVRAVRVRTSTNLIAWVVAGALLLGSGGFLIGATYYSQSVGEAKVIVSKTGTIIRQDTLSGAGWKSPWHKVSDWDLFSQELVYAGGKEGAPDYTGGKVNGQQVTSSVKGNAQANFDLTVSYNLDGEHVTDLYTTYRSQEKFTRQVVETQVLGIARAVATDYTPTEFRGAKRGEATDRIRAELNKALEKYGVDVTLVTIQEISFTEDVEASIKAVEVAQQKEAQAQAELRATEVSSQAQVIEAQAEADAKIAAATGEAEANRLLAESLSPEVLESKRLDTLKAIGDKGNLVVVPEGSTPFVQVTPQAGK